MGQAEQLAVVDGLFSAIIEASHPDEKDNVWFASMDNNVLALIRQRGYPFEAIAPSRMYLGSETTPVMTRVKR